MFLVRLERIAFEGIVDRQLEIESTCFFLNCYKGAKVECILSMGYRLIEIDERLHILDDFLRVLWSIKLGWIGETILIECGLKYREGAERRVWAWECSPNPWAWVLAIVVFNYYFLSLLSIIALTFIYFRLFSLKD